MIGGGRRLATRRTNDFGMRRATREASRAAAGDLLVPQPAAPTGHYSAIPSVLLPAPSMKRAVASRNRRFTASLQRFLAWASPAYERVRSLRISCAASAHRPNGSWLNNMEQLQNLSMSSRSTPSGVFDRFENLQS